jgi:MFS family permease
MLLPSMGTSLHLNYSQMGLIGTGNFVGYMISVALAGMFARTIGARRTIVGGLSIASGPLFGWLSDRLGRKIGMMTVYTLFTVAYALVAANLPNIFLYASIGIFGLAVWSIPTIMSAAVGDYMGPARAVGETMDSPLKPGSWFQYDLSSSRSIHIWNTFD